MTEEKLAQAVKDGLGQGREERYKAWIRVRRNLHSPVSNLQVMHTPLYKRELHLLSGLEYQSAAVGLWLGATEVREQKPAWPEEHVHPNAGLHPDLDRRLRPVRGLLEIARAAGIDHGRFPGTKIPYVATIDFMWSVGSWSNRRIVNWGCKPPDLIAAADSNSRMMERIQLERLYSDEIGAAHRTVTGSEWGRQLTDNLDFLMPLKSQLSDSANQSLAEEFSDHFMIIGEGDPIRDACRYAQQKMGVSLSRAHDLFRMSAWRGLIDMDLSLPISMTRPMRRDQGLKDQLRERLFSATGPAQLQQFAGRIAK